MIFLLLAAVFPAAGVSQSDFTEEEREFIEKVINDQWPKYRQFTEMAFGEAIDGSIIGLTTLNERQEALDSQLPSNIQSLPRSELVRVLFLETCDGHTLYGYPDDPNTNDERFRFLYLIRFSIALYEAELHENISANFLLPILFDGGLPQANLTLLHLYTAGVMQVPHILLEDGAEC